MTTEAARPGANAIQIRTLLEPGNLALLVGRGALADFVYQDKWGQAYAAAAKKANTKNNAQRTGLREVIVNKAAAISNAANKKKTNC